MKKSLIIVFTLIFVIQLNAQNDTSGNKCNFKIIEKGNPIIPYSTYFVNGKKISHNQVGRILGSYGPSAIEYKKREKMYKYFALSVYPTLALYAVTMAYTFSGTHKNPNPTGQALLIGTFTGVTASLVFGIQSRKHYQKSKNLYNCWVCDR